MQCLDIKIFDEGVPRAPIQNLKPIAAHMVNSEVIVLESMDPISIIASFLKVRHPSAYEQTKAEPFNVSDGRLPALWTMKPEAVI